MIFIEQDIGAAPITATLPKVALTATSSAVVTVSKDVTTMHFAAIEKTLPFVDRYPISYVVLHGVTMRAFLYDVARQESVYRSNVRGKRWGLIEDISLFVVIIVFEETMIINNAVG